jgi:hypothetical protein
MEDLMKNYRLNMAKKGARRFTRGKKKKIKKAFTDSEEKEKKKFEELQRYCLWGISHFFVPPKCELQSYINESELAPHAVVTENIDGTLHISYL